MDISTLLNLINYIFVLIFGIIVSFYFADIRLEDNHKLFIYTTLTFPYTYTFNSCHKICLP